MYAITTGPRAALLAALLLGALAPMGLHGNAATCSSAVDRDEVKATLRSTTPLTEQLSTSQLLHRFTGEDGRTLHYQDTVNGVDAYVYDLDCEATPVRYELKTLTKTDMMGQAVDIDMAVQFFDADYRYLGMDTEEDDLDPGDEPLDGRTEDGTRYMVVIVDEGPLVTNIDYEQTPPQPYTTKFRLTVA